MGEREIDGFDGPYSREGNRSAIIGGVLLVSVRTLPNNIFDSVIIESP